MKIVNEKIKEIYQSKQFHQYLTKKISEKSQLKNAKYFSDNQ